TCYAIWTLPPKWEFRENFLLKFFLAYRSHHSFINYENRDTSPRGMTRLEETLSSTITRGLT
ncbi:hypothetical protein ACJX0J_040168, partial [Zea mays]